MSWDVIVVGGRCAGAPLAMLLARAGQRVLVLDKARFPSDTVSTHTIQLSGVHRLHQWGLLPQVLATGCPPLESTCLDLGFVRLIGRPHPLDGITTTLCCRRIVLDQILLEAAASAGAVVRPSSPVTGVIVEDNRVVGVRVAGRGREIAERATVVVGADGHRSSLARLVGAPVLHGHGSKTFTYYAYWAGLPFSRVELFFRPGLAMAALPTNDNVHIVVVQRPIAAFNAFRADVSESFLRCVDAVPRLGEAVRQGERAEHFRGAPDQFGLYRSRRGCGWVLAGDAACHKDSVTARGISDAFEDAHSLAATLRSALERRSSLDAALMAWERRCMARIFPVYTRAASLADLAAPGADEAARLRQIAQDQDATDAFLSVDAGTGQRLANDGENARKECRQ